MVAQNQPPCDKVSVKLLPQEKEGGYTFDGQFVATPAAHIMLNKEVKLKGGLNYLQVFEIDGERLWFIDDITHVTCLLPDDY